MPEINPSQDGTTQGADRRTGGGLLDQGADRQSQVEVMPIGDTQGLQGETLDGSVDPLLADELIREYSPVVYFEYDQFSVDEESMKTLKHYSDQMVENPSLTVTLEGHTDERGSPSYNLALGEKRAKAVAEVMMLYGVSQNRITLISFGEEQPAEMGHDEAAWSKNRRVELRF
jgi:peptidoglycan-associated lipoprotein